MENKTKCECPLAGFCNRHGIEKTKHWHKLCQNHVGYFNMWEECRGPGQQFIDCNNKPQKTEDKLICKFCQNTKCTGECRNKQSKPSTIQMAKNLAESTVKHVKSGLLKVTEEERQKRLDICSDCEFYIPKEDRCGKCGCYMKSKSTWKTGQCPIGKW